MADRLADQFAIRVTYRDGGQTTFLALGQTYLYLFTTTERAEAYAERFRESFGDECDYDVLPVEVDPT